MDPFDPFDFFDDAIGGIAEWHYTSGWGSLATVTVASIAIIAGVVVSKITLRRNAAQFEQSRLDAAIDKFAIVREHDARLQASLVSGIRNTRKISNACPSSWLD